MHEPEWMQGSWGHVFAMELVTWMCRAGVEVRITIPEDYPTPFRGDIAFHAREEPAFAAYDCVRVSVLESHVTVHSFYKGEQQTEFLTFKRNDDTTPRGLAGRVWHECAHGVVAWMTPSAQTNASVTP